MFSYNRKEIVILSIVICIIVCICINIILFYFQKNLSQKNIETQTLVLKISKITPIIEETVNKEENTDIAKEENTNIYLSNNWRILIPKINLNAPILEGVTNDNMRRGVAHFEQTSKWDGNICLAAHNRGYKYNYFQEIHTLEKGDVIIYKNENNEERKYVVEINEKIQETDWSYLKETKENKITLITCVKDMPEYRTCIQAKQII